MSRVELLGTCVACGLRFAGEPEDRAAIDQLLRLHLRHCAGGNRAGEVWQPYRSVYESRGRHVLVVDDDPEVRAALRALLQIMGHRVDEAADGSSAVVLARERRPDVVIIDINLPGMNGYEVARRVRTATGRAVPRLVALTGYGRPEDRRLAQEAGFDEFLVKPAEAEEIERVVSAGVRLPRPLA